MEYDESFMINVQGDTWKNLLYFFDLISTVKGHAAHVFPLETFYDDMIPFLVENKIPIIDNVNENKNSFILSRNPWEAFRYANSKDGYAYILLLNDVLMKKEWYNAMERFLLSVITFNPVRLVFFSPDDESFNKHLSFLSMVQSLKVQRMTRRRIGIFGNAVWDDDKKDFVTISEMKRDIESMIDRFKKEIDELADMVKSMQHSK